MERRQIMSFYKTNFAPIIMSVIISHINMKMPDGKQIQNNDEHCLGVAELAKNFANEFGFGEWGFVMGLLHDKGKEKQAFQDYIKRASGYDLSVPILNGRDKNHAYVGALIAKKIYGTIADLITNEIAGHHTGLYDYTELENIMTNNIPNEVDCNVKKYNLPLAILKEYTDIASVNHLWRMLFSCLVDADWLDTERFMDNTSFVARQNNTTIQMLKNSIDASLESFKQAPNTAVNQIRTQIQKECLKASALPSGFYSLTVPTGGGKTISSIVWAINHAIYNDKKRIIIAIPYTSIIVQTASVLKSIFGDDNVLEHHSNVEYYSIEDESMRQKFKLATENWDYPIIVTTNVQLFESMYSNKPSDCRKLHNICNSVVILDEVQTLPTDFLQPIVDALKCYQKHFGVSVLFTTASQPILSGIIEGCNPISTFNGIESIREIIPNDMHLHKKLKRVELDIDNNGKTYDDVAEQLAKHNKVLCIVNTRRDAQELYNRLPNEGIKLHLSKMMCPSHIKQTIKYIKDSLKNEDNKIIRVIATQLIEAGVDIDFPVVFRQEAGLDSILQAAGRCNREGKQNICNTHVFSLSKEHPINGSSINDANNARLNMVGVEDWFAPETMTEYFKQLYCRKENFDKKNIVSLLYKAKELCFKTAATEFCLIDDTSTPIIVNWEDSMGLVDKLKSEGPSYALIKKIGQYTVSVRQNDLKKLLKAGNIEEIMDSIFVCRGKSQYNDKIGLLTDNQWLEETFIL